MLDLHDADHVQRASLVGQHDAVAGRRQLNEAIETARDAGLVAEDLHHPRADPCADPSSADQSSPAFAARSLSEVSGRAPKWLMISPRQRLPRRDQDARGGPWVRP